MRDHPSGSSIPSQLSPWWRHAVILTMIGGFTVLIWLSIRVYHDAPPIPAQVVSSAGDTLFTREDIVAGQQLFLRYGLMENGSIWGHGAYLGPDFSAAYLHALAIDVGETLATERYNRRLDALTAVQRVRLTQRSNTC
jgi:nitric oxide reductase subunit B